VNFSTSTGGCGPAQAVPTSTVASCGTAYRQGALYAYVAALITAGMGGMQAENIALEGLRRSVAALDDLDTVSLLEKSL
jgi:hypothetical protein